MSLFNLQIGFFFFSFIRVIVKSLFLLCFNSKFELAVSSDSCN